MIGWLIEVLTYGAIGALVGATWANQQHIENAKPCISHHEWRQLSPHEQEPDPTPATAPMRWDEERYSL